MHTMCSSGDLVRSDLHLYILLSLTSYPYLALRALELSCSQFLSSLMLVNISDYICKLRAVVCNGDTRGLGALRYLVR